MHLNSMHDVPPSVWGVSISSSFSSLSLTTLSPSHFLSVVLAVSVIRIHMRPWNLWLFPSGTHFDNCLTHIHLGPLYSPNIQRHAPPFFLSCLLSAWSSSTSTRDNLVTNDSVCLTVSPESTHLLFHTCVRRVDGSVFLNCPRMFHHSLPSPLFSRLTPTILFWQKKSTPCVTGARDSDIPEQSLREVFNDVSKYIRNISITPNGLSPNYLLPLTVGLANYWAWTRDQALPWNALMQAFGDEKDSSRPDNCLGVIDRNFREWSTQIL